MAKKIFQDEIDVLKYQRDKINKLNKGYSELSNEIYDFEKKIQEFMISKNREKLKVNKCILENENENSEVKNVKKESMSNKSFNDLIYEANKEGYSNADILEVATAEEIYEANNILKAYYNEYTDQYKLDNYDYAISGIIGSVAALMDFF